MKKRSMKLLALVVALVMSLGIIAACAPAAEEPAPPAAADPPAAPADEAAPADDPPPAADAEAPAPPAGDTGARFEETVTLSILFGRDTVMEPFYAAFDLLYERYNIAMDIDLRPGGPEGEHYIHPGGIP